MGNRARRARSLTRGERNAAWIEAVCRVPEGVHVGQPVKLRAWQRDIICGIYDTPTRRAIVSFGRKNGKTALAAMLLLLHLVGPEARPNSQLYSAAQSREQAAVLFALAAKMVRLSPDLNAHVIVRDTAKQLACEELGTLYRALSAEASTAYGLSPVFVVHDELGQVHGPRSELYEALETASGAQAEPLSVIISTQAAKDDDLLSTLIDDAKSGVDPKVKLFLYSASADVDAFGEDAIRAANPAFGDFLNPAEVLDMAARAKRMPSAEASYRNLILNQRVAAESPFIPAAVWKTNASAVDEEAFESGPVFAGLDLSARHDLTAFVLVARGNDGVWNVRAHFWTPQHGLRERAQKDRAPYDVWASQGYIEATPGSSVDYATVAQFIADMMSEHDIRAIGFDRWRIDVMQREFERLDVSVPLVPVGQGFRDMTPALDAVEGELLAGRVRHGGNPVLTMCAMNARAVRDAAGNMKLDKMRSTGRIDGMVAMAMAMRVAGATIEQQATDHETPFLDLNMMAT